MNNRRKLIVALGAGALAAPLASFSQQQGKVWRVGLLTLRSRPASLDSDVLNAFIRGMRQLGYVEGKNLTLEFRFGDGKPERLPELAAELVGLKVDVIVASAGAASRAAKKATTTIPIIFAGVSDPVGYGLIKSLAQPGGNATGITNITADLGAKRFELLLAMVPKVSRMAVLIDSNAASNTRFVESIQAMGKKRSVMVLRVDAGTPMEIETAFSTMVRENAGGLILSLTPLFQQQRSQIVELAVKHRLPAIAADRVFAEAGCLMSYGNNLADDYHRLATYVDKIFKGAKPSDLPVEQPTKFELIINGKTAKALGLTIPQSMLVSAEVIE